MRKLLILLLGQIMGASSVIFIRFSGIQAGFLAGDRLLLAALLLLPLFLFERRQIRSQLGNSPTQNNPLLLRSLVPGMLLGLHLASWNLGVRLTTATNATLIVNLVPVAMPIVAFFVLREKPRNFEILGTLVAVGGLLILGVGAITLDQQNLKGDLVCFLSMILFAVYLALGRRNASVGLWTYIVPLYAVGGVTAYLMALPFGNPLTQPFTAKDIYALVGLTLICTIGGHTINNWAMRNFRAQLVSLLASTQFVWAGIAAWLVFAEYPQDNFYLSCTVILVGVAIAVVPRIIKYTRSNQQKSARK